LHEKELCDGLAASIVIYDETVSLQARSFTTPANSALTFRDFVPRLELLTFFRDFRSSMKMCEIIYFSLFCKSYLVLFFTSIIGTPILCCSTTYSGIFCFREFCSFIVRALPAKYDSARTELEVELRKILAFGQVRAKRK